MGIFRHPLILLSATRDRAETVGAVVDTGSIFTWVPAPVLEGLGLDPEFEEDFRLADGRLVRRPMAEVRVELLGRRRTTLVVFGIPGTAPLLGAYTLEAFSLAADPTNRRLVPGENYALHSDGVSQLRP